MATKENVEVEIVQISSNVQLEKTFNLWTTCALQFSLICTSLAIGTFLSTVIGVGGSPALIYGFILAVGFALIVCFCLAEIASAYPHSSAQVHWTYVLFPQKLKRGASFTVGVLSCAGWIFACFSSTYVACSFVYALVAVYHPDFVPTNWQIYLVYTAILIAGCSMNLLVKIIPHVTYSLVAVVNVGTLFILITLLVKTQPKQLASFVFQNFINETGWSNNGLVFFLSLLPPIASVTLYDGACHMTDEIEMPEKNIPWVMVISNSSSALLGFIAAIIYMFCVKNITALSSPIGGQPIVQLMLDSFESQALTTIGVLVLTYTFIFSSCIYYTSTSRLYWSFAKSNGLPFGNFFGQVNEKLKVPVNALGLVMGICLILGLMIFGSSSALNAVLGSSMVCINLSYIFPIGALLYRSGCSMNVRKRFNDSASVVNPATRLPYFHLGKAGLFMNIASVLWAIFISIWLNFPSMHPVNSDSMNYACVVLGITLLVGIIFWVVAGRKHYNHDPDMKH